MQLPAHARVRVVSLKNGACQSGTSISTKFCLPLNAWDSETSNRDLSLRGHDKTKSRVIAAHGIGKLIKGLPKLRLNELLEPTDAFFDDVARSQTQEEARGRSRASLRP